MSAENGLVKIEGGQTSYAMEALTDSGDAKTFTSQATRFSGDSGKEPDVKPDGLATGGVVSPAVSGTDNLVDMAELTGYLAGVLKPLSAAVDQAITRALTNVASISSITVDSAGVFAVIQGADSLDVNFVTTRGGDGGPPYIPVGSFELAQIRTASNAAAPITAAEIFQVIGVHQERYDFPSFTIDSFKAQVVMSSSLALIHTADKPKNINASYADPIFIEVPKTKDFVPSENSHSVSSEQYYGGTVGSTSTSLGQGSFTVAVNDGITDPIVKAKDKILWVMFFPDKYKTPYILDQGKLGVSRAFPAAGTLTCSCTISASTAAKEVES